VTNDTKCRAVQDGGTVVPVAGQQPLDPSFHATEAELRRVVSERDAFQQEVFETDRFAARVSHERQNLLWRNEALQAELATVTEALDQHKQAIAASSHERENLLLRNEALEAKLATATEALEAERATATEALDQHKQAIAAIYASMSWKLTRPLRALKNLLDFIRTR
jgi:chromosome segregation ATPase